MKVVIVIVEKSTPSLEEVTMKVAIVIVEKSTIYLEELPTASTLKVVSMASTLAISQIMEFRNLVHEMNEIPLE